ncbi:hypothetical protein OsJ_21861 [Oryza sativa Japonica Group]|uniref:Uncharacterized protein n=1 Tax=Oryza sativa subsp. japonica TaxID=39947 RepID=A3BD92_ORYSJ|nr:hypothetical protein OsJ_21861 [Oryza sativa Japonica Group]
MATTRLSPPAATFSPVSTLPFPFFPPLAKLGLHVHPLELEKTNLLLPGTLYPLLPGTLYPLQESFPKAKKFRTKSFPLFEALGELYDGYTAEGTYNFTSTEPLQHPIITQVESDQDDLGNTEIIFLDYEDTLAYQVQDDVDATEDDNANAERLKEMPHRRVVAVPRNKEEKEPKRQKKSVGVEGLMERYLDMRTKQTEDEAAQLAREKEAHLAREKEAQLAREKEAHLAREKESNDFSIKRCISVLNSMDVTKAEKVKAYTVFKNSENREIFVSACDEDPESALSWLRSEMA